MCLTETLCNTVRAADDVRGGDRGTVGAEGSLPTAADIMCGMHNHFWRRESLDSRTQTASSELARVASVPRDLTPSPQTLSAVVSKRFVLLRQSPIPSVPV